MTHISDSKPSWTFTPRFRVSLALFLFGFTATALIFGLVASRLGRARAQRAAVEAILETGGSVCYSDGFDYQSMVTTDGRTYWASTKNPRTAPQETWMRSSMGRDFFDNVTMVVIGSEDVVNAMRQIGSLPAVRKVVFRDTQPCDIDVSYLICLKDLEEVVVRGKANNTGFVSKLRSTLPGTEVWADVSTSEDTISFP